MAAWQAVILGILQGLAEFLPISSSGHLLIGEKLLGVTSGGASLEILLHLGTLVAVVIVFWGDICEILSHPIKDPRFRQLVVATIPAVIVALLFRKTLEGLFEGWFLGVSFLITSLILFMGEWIQSRRGRRPINTVNMGHAISMGLMQALGTVPGISRSGSTIMGGVATGLERDSAARFSFMMAAIAIVGSAVFDIKNLPTVFAGGWTAPLAGMLAAMVTGYLAIRWMLNLLKTKTMKPFAWYVLVVGLLVLCDQTFFHRYFTF